MRDFAMPEPGFYGILYNYFYSTDRLNNADGDQIRSVVLPPGPGPITAIDIDVDLSLYALSPTLVWISDWKLFGGTYGAYALVPVANSNVAVALSAQTGSGRNAETSQFGISDPFLQPLWLGWRSKHWDAMLAYGFYAPLGKYETEIITLPVVGSFRAESKDNVGLGFWTHQVQGAVNWYPPDDEGSDAHNPSVHDEVHSVGGQAGVTVVPWNTALNLRYIGEVSAADRFQGQSFGINLAVKL